MKYEINLNNKKYVIEVADTKAVILEKTNNIPKPRVDEDYVDVPDFDFSCEDSSGDANVRSPLFGTVLSVSVKNDEHVKKGDVLLVLESMKMESEIIAQDDCVIDQVLVQEGSFVEKNQVLLFIKEK